MSDDQDSEIRYDKHPGLRNFNRVGYMITKSVKETIKWAAIGAIAAVGAIAAIGLVVGWSNPVTAGLGLLASYIIPSVGAGAAGAAITALSYAAIVGGAVGAAAGGVVAISGASEMADSEEDRRVAKFEQAEARRDRLSALERRRDEQKFAMEKQEYALRNPNMQIPRGKAAQGFGHAPTA